MVDVVRKHGVVTQDPSKPLSPRLETENEYFFGLVEKCNVFVVAGSGQWEVVAALEPPGGGLFKERIDLPFPVCSFEMLSDEESFTAQVGEEIILIRCFLAYEFAPLQYDIFSLIQTHNGKVAVTYASSRQGGPIYNRLANCINHTLDVMNRGAAGIEKVKEIIRVGRGDKKRIYKLRRIVHISPKGKQFEKNPASNRIIDWSHRWEVRGHWRELAEGKIGKDRDGVYCINSFTWVTDFTKGPETAPLIKKVRVIETDLNNSTHQ